MPRNASHAPLETQLQALRDEVTALQCGFNDARQRVADAEAAARSIFYQLQARQTALKSVRDQLKAQAVIQRLAIRAEAAVKTKQIPPRAKGTVEWPADTPVHP